jgi:hypothetical protein
MNLNEQAHEAIKMIDAQISELLSIKDAFKQKNISSADGLEKIEEWKERTIELLSQKVHPNEALNLEKKNEWLLSEDPLTSFRKTIDVYSSFLNTLKGEIEKHPADIISTP